MGWCQILQIATHDPFFAAWWVQSRYDLPCLQPAASGARPCGSQKARWRSRLPKQSAEHLGMFSHKKPQKCWKGPALLNSWSAKSGWIRNLTCSNMAMEKPPCVLRKSPTGHVRTKKMGSSQNPMLYHNFPNYSWHFWMSFILGSTHIIFLDII